MGRLFLLFTLVPLAELYLLIWLGGKIGFWSTVAIVAITGVLGAALAKAEGLKVVQEWQESLSRGEMPAEGVLGGLMVLVGGVLLVTPGVMTDFLGFALLLPVSRKAMVGVVRRHVERQIADGRLHVQGFGGPMGPMGPMGRGPMGPPPGWGGGHTPPPPGVIDVDAVEVVDADSGAGSDEGSGSGPILPG